MVPPVPTPAAKMSTAPPAAFQISGPVVSRWAAALAGLLNWSGMKLPGSCAESSRAFSIAPAIPLRASVRTTSAP